MHRFGGGWTAAKLAALRDYLASYTTALKNQRFFLQYIDAFAGSGTYVPTGNDGEVPLKGSAQIALETAGFDRYIFIEKDGTRCADLAAFCGDYSDKDVWVKEGDANEVLQRICAETNWSGSRAALFLDPYGMQVEWETLQAIAKTRSIDVWYLFPLNGALRQLPHDPDKLDDDKRRSLDRVLGAGEWKEALYSTRVDQDLFGTRERNERHNWTAVMEWVTGRLRGVFPTVVGPVVLRVSRDSRRGGGPPLYALYFLAANPSPKVRGLATNLAKGVLDKLAREHSTH